MKAILETYRDSLNVNSTFLLRRYKNSRNLGASTESSNYANCQVMISLFNDKKMNTTMSKLLQIPKLLSEAVNRRRTEKDKQNTTQKTKG